MTNLSDVLGSVEWDQNVADFVSQSQAIDRYQRGCQLIAVWAHELRFQEFDNPATAFLMEMQASSATVPTCAALGLYKPAAASMRAAVENALYFSFFSTHPSELHTQVAKTDYYETKSTILDYHKTHTTGFKEKQRGVGLLSELEAWYSEISAIIHGQKPGTWTNRAVNKTEFVQDLDKLCADSFSRCVAIVNMLFLITTPDEIWEGFNSKSRRMFLKGFSKQKKSIIGRSLI